MPDERHGDLGHVGDDHQRDEITPISERLSRQGYGPAGSS